MKGKDFQRWVTDTAQTLGWRYWHVPAPMVNAGSRGWVPARQGAGLPDLILVHDDPPRLVFAEIKGDGDRLSEKQREFLQAVRAVAEDEWTRDSDADGPHLGVYVWEPGMEQPIEELLRSRVLS